MYLKDWAVRFFRGQVWIILLLGLNSIPGTAATNPTIGATRSLDVDNGVLNATVGPAFNSAMYAGTTEPQNIHEPVSSTTGLLDTGRRKTDEATSPTIGEGTRRHEGGQTTSTLQGSNGVSSTSTEKIDGKQSPGETSKLSSNMAVTETATVSIPAFTVSEVNSSSKLVTQPTKSTEDSSSSDAGSHISDDVTETPALEKISTVGTDRITTEGLFQETSAGGFQNNKPNISDHLVAQMNTPTTQTDTTITQTNTSLAQKALAAIAETPSESMPHSQGPGTAESVSASSISASNPGTTTTSASISFQTVVQTLENSQPGVESEALTAVEGTLEKTVPLSDLLKGSTDESFIDVGQSSDIVTRTNLDLTAPFLTSSISRGTSVVMFRHVEQTSLGDPPILFSTSTPGLTGLAERLVSSTATTSQEKERFLTTIAEVLEGTTPPPINAKATMFVSLTSTEGMPAGGTLSSKTLVDEISPAIPSAVLQREDGLKTPIANTGKVNIEDNTKLAPQTTAADMSKEINTTGSHTSEGKYLDTNTTDSGSAPWSEAPGTEKVQRNETRADDSPPGSSQAESEGKQDGSAPASSNLETEGETARRTGMGFERLVKNKLLMLHLLPTKMPDYIRLGFKDTSDRGTMTNDNEPNNTAMADEITRTTATVEVESGPTNTTTEAGEERTTVIRPVAPKLRLRGKFISLKRRPMTDNKHVEGIPVSSNRGGERTTVRHRVVPKYRQGGKLISPMSRPTDNNIQVGSTPNLSATGDESTTVSSPEVSEDRINNDLLSTMSRPIDNNIQVESTPNLSATGDESTTVSSPEVSGDKLTSQLLSSKNRPITDNKQTEITTGDHSATVRSPEVSEVRINNRPLSSKTRPVNDNKQVQSILISSSMGGENATVKSQEASDVGLRNGLFSSQSRPINGNKQVENTPIATIKVGENATVRSPEVPEVSIRSGLLSFNSRPISDNKQDKITTGDGDESATIISPEVSEVRLKNGLLSSKSRPMNDNKQIESTPIPTTTGGENATVKSQEVSDVSLTSGLSSSRSRPIHDNNQVGSNPVTSAMGGENATDRSPEVSGVKLLSQILSYNNRPISTNKQAEITTEAESATIRSPEVSEVRLNNDQLSSRPINNNTQVHSMPNISVTGDESTTVSSAAVSEVKLRSQLLLSKSRHISDKEQAEITTEAESATTRSPEVPEVRLNNDLPPSKSRPINNNKQLESTPITTTREGENTTVKSPEVSEVRLRSGLHSSQSRPINDNMQVENTSESSALATDEEPSRGKVMGFRLIVRNTLSAFHLKSPQTPDNTTMRYNSTSRDRFMADGNDSKSVIVTAENTPVGTIQATQSATISSPLAPEDAPVSGPTQADSPSASGAWTVTSSVIHSAPPGHPPQQHSQATPTWPPNRNILLAPAVITCILYRSQFS